MSNFETNPISIAIHEAIQELLFEDLGKSEIREKIKSAYPNFPDHQFDQCFSNAFCSLV